MSYRNNDTEFRIRVYWYHIQMERGDGGVRRCMISHRTKEAAYNCRHDRRGIVRKVIGGIY